MGPLDEDDLRAVWRSAVDPTYAEDLERAGDGGGLEAVGQNHAQLARVARAGDETFQQFYAKPWSGQTYEPAGGALRAEVTIRLSRRAGPDGLPHIGLLFLAGEIVVEEEVPDWSREGTVLQRTGRRYVLVEDVCLLPGESGPIEALFVAEHAGAGPNNPRPGSLSAFDQEGAGYDNADASVTFTGFGPADPAAHATALIVASPEPQVFVPGNVGALVRMLEGDNAGQYFRARYYAPPGVADGGSVAIDLLHVVRKASGSTAMAVGERVAFTQTIGPFDVIGWGTLVHQRVDAGAATFFVRIDSGAPSTRIVGQQSAVTNACDGVWHTTAPVAETLSAEWRVVRWQDVLDATNPASPAGGRADMLDEIGRERLVSRATPGEDDDAYRKRVTAVADAVSPNAIKRAVARVLTPLGQEGVLREVGTPQQPGIFWDHFFWDHAQWWADGAITSGPGFIEGETIQQDVGGVLTRLVFVGMSLSNTRVHGAHRFRRDQSFKSAIAPIVGLRSGTVFTPTAVGGWAGRYGRYDWFLDLAWMRGSFLVSLPRTSEGEAGAAWNAPGNVGFYDAGAYAGVWDGGPVLERGKLLALWRALNIVHGGGVLFAVVNDEGTDDNG